MLDHVADAIIDRVLMTPHKGASVRCALEQAYPFGSQPAGRLIWDNALLRHSHRIVAVETFLYDTLPDVRTETLDIDLSAELERVWKQENARRLLQQLASTYLQ